MVIPSNANKIKDEIKKVDKENSFIAPWNYCQENKDKWDHVDSFETLEKEDTTCMFSNKFQLRKSYANGYSDLIPSLPQRDI